MSSNTRSLRRKTIVAPKARRPRRERAKPRIPYPPLVESSLQPLAVDASLLMKQLTAVVTRHAKSVDSGQGPTNAEITADKRQLRALRREINTAQKLRKLVGQLDEILDRYSELIEDRYAEAQQITEITPSGLGIQIRDGLGGGDSFEMIAVGVDGREAHVLRNSSHRRRYTLHLLASDMVGFNATHDECQGDDWTFEEASAEARFWVVGGVLPPDPKFRHDL